MNFKSYFLESVKSAGRQKNTIYTQDSIGNTIIKMVAKIPNAKRIKKQTAETGHKTPDVIVDFQINDQPRRIQVEVKSVGSNRPVRFFDKTVSRSNRSPGPSEVLNAVFPPDFEYQVDQSKCGGFPGDTVRSPCPSLPARAGRLPKQDFLIKDKNKFYKIIKRHWRQGGDNYFAVVNTNNNQQKIWYTGTGENILNLPLFKITDIRQAWADTYGDSAKSEEAAKGKMRVSLAGYLS